MPLSHSGVEIGRSRREGPGQAITGFSADPKKNIPRAINRRMSATRAALMVLAAALLFSTGGAAIKTQTFSALQVSGARSGLAFLVLLAWARGRIQFSPVTLGIGVAYASILTLFVESTKLTTAADAIFLQSTAPLYILFLAPAILGEHLHR